LISCGQSDVTLFFGNMDEAACRIGKRLLTLCQPGKSISLIMDIDNTSCTKPEIQSGLKLGGVSPNQREEVRLYF
jgi:hypothetical protein